MIIYKAEGFTYQLTRFQFGGHGTPTIDGRKVDRQPGDYAFNSTLEVKHIMAALFGEQLYVDQSKEHSVEFIDLDEKDNLILRGLIAHALEGRIGYYG